MIGISGGVGTSASTSLVQTNDQGVHPFSLALPSSLAMNQEGKIQLSLQFLILDYVRPA